MGRLQTENGEDEDTRLIQTRKERRHVVEDGVGSGR